jgi:hypothetical protein
MSRTRPVLADDDVLLREGVEVEHAMDLLASGHRTGYLLKSRITDVAEFIDTLKRVGPGRVGGGSGAGAETGGRASGRLPAVRRAGCHRQPDHRRGAPVG